MRFLVAGLVLGLSLAATSCAGTQCSFNSQCGSHRYCSMSRCYQDCLTDTDCPVHGQVCSPVGQCVAGVDGGVVDMARDMPSDMSGPPTDMPGVDLGTPDVDMGTPPVDMGMPPVDMGMPPIDMGMPPVDMGTPKGYLADCTSDAECMSGHCIAEGPGTSHVCSKTCSSDVECADWHYCLRPGTATTGPGVCAYDDTGASCTATTGSCSFACLYSDPNPGHCTHQCSTSNDCPGGYACVYSSAGDSTSLKVCAWIHETCPTDVTQCDTSVGGCGYSPGSQCTGNCASSSDCPAIAGTPYTCTVVSGIPYSICAPPDASDGPSGAPCVASVPCLFGAPLPINVRHATSEGRPSASAASIARAISAKSCPSQLSVCHPVARNRAGMSSLVDRSVLPSMVILLSSHRTISRPRPRWPARPMAS